MNSLPDYADDGGDTNGRMSQGEDDSKNGNSQSDAFSGRLNTTDDMRSTNSFSTKMKSRLGLGGVPMTLDKESVRQRGESLSR
jgi:hypothetical protein